MNTNKQYDVAIIGAGPGGIYAAYELSQKSDLKVAVIEAGHSLHNRKCPMQTNPELNCCKCEKCSIMQGFGGAGAFSDGKFNITNEFGGDLYKYTGSKSAIDLMHYVGDINAKFGAAGVRWYDNYNSPFKLLCTQNNLKLLGVEMCHLGTDLNYQVLSNIYDYLENKVDFIFNTTVDDVSIDEFTGNYKIKGKVPCHPLVDCMEECIEAKKVIVAAGRSGSAWVEHLCDKLHITKHSNRVDLGVRVEVPSMIFDHLTDELYESKIVYRTEKYEDDVRTFCMNPHGEVVNENTNGILTVNGHSYSEEDPRRTNNTNFALLVNKSFTEPFEDSNAYGESIAKLSNMLGGGVIIQRFGDLIRGRRSTHNRINENSFSPTLNATPGDLSLVLPKRILDDIVEMIYALDKIAKGTANDDTLLYGVEVKFYNMKVLLDSDLETSCKGLYMIGDGSGVTHSLAHAAASGIHVARRIIENV